MRYHRRSASRDKKAIPPTTPPAIAPVLVLLPPFPPPLPPPEPAPAPALALASLPSTDVTVDVDPSAAVVVATTVDGPFPLRDAASADDLDAASALEELADSEDRDASMINCGSSSMEMRVAVGKHLNMDRAGVPVQTKVPHSGWSAFWQHPVCGPADVHLLDCTAS